MFPEKVFPLDMPQKNIFPCVMAMSHADVQKTGSLPQHSQTLHFEDSWVASLSPDLTDPIHLLTLRGLYPTSNPVLYSTAGLMVHLCNEKLFPKPLTLMKLLDFGSGLLLYLFIL